MGRWLVMAGLIFGVLFTVLATDRRQRDENYTRPLLGLVGSIIAIVVGLAVYTPTG